MTRRIFPGPIAAIGGIEVGVGDDRKTVIDEEGNIYSEGHLEFEDGFVGDLVGDVTGNLVGNVTGNVTGNLSGSVVGNVSGNLIGNVIGDLTGDVSGNLVGDVTGNLVGDVTGDVTGYTMGMHLGDVMSAIAPESASELGATYGVEENAWRLFFTADGDLALLTPTGVKLVTLTDPPA